MDLTPKQSDNGNGAVAVRTKAGNGERRREELADFLRTKRSSLQPEDVGLPDGSRRRTPGLRREEVALLAGVGTTWYTWLEQGRDVRASLDVLEALARALRLTPAERSHLILLGRGEHAKPCKAPAEEVSPNLRRLVENIGPGPAYLLGRRWDYLAWNRPFEAVFSWAPGARSAFAQPRLAVVHGSRPGARCARAIGQAVRAWSWPSSARTARGTSATRRSRSWSPR